MIDWPLYRLTGLAEDSKYPVKSCMACAGLADMRAVQAHVPGDGLSHDLQRCLSFHKDIQQPVEMGEITDVRIVG